MKLVEFLKRYRDLPSVFLLLPQTKLKVYKKFIMYSYAELGYPTL